MGVPEVPEKASRTAVNDPRGLCNLVLAPDETIEIKHRRYKRDGKDCGKHKGSRLHGCRLLHSG